MDSDYSELISAIRRGEHDAFQSFQSEFRRLVYVAISSQGVPPSSAEELSGTLLTEILIARFEKFNPTKGSLPAWLWTVASNAARDWRRRPANQRTVPLEPNTQASFATANPLAEAVVQGALAKLPEAYAEIIRLREFAAMDYAAIAGVLNITEGNARIRHKRAYEQLRCLLEQDPRFSRVA